MTGKLKSRQSLTARVREVRRDRFGDGEAALATLATGLGIPALTWKNYEAGVTMPAEIMLKFIDQTCVAPSWLLTGSGERYSTADFGSGRRPPL